MISNIIITFISNIVKRIQALQNRIKQVSYPSANTKSGKTNLSARFSSLTEKKSMQ